MMKLVIIVPFLNQVNVTQKGLELLLKNKLEKDTEIIAYDNGSDDKLELDNVKIIRNEENIGNYPVFFDVRRRITKGEINGDIIAFLHSDLYVEEAGFDTRIIDIFEKKPNVGLLGFVWSTEIDSLGGRGLGTACNFQGNFGGSIAEIHGKRHSGYSDAVVLDGCSMIFRKDVLMRLPLKVDFPPHHFYDKLISCQVQEMGYSVGGLGIACDHLGGVTANTQNKYDKLASEWCKKHLGIENPQDYLFLDNIDFYLKYERGQYYPITKIENWDTVIYLEAERQFLKEYKFKKGFIPRKV